MNNSFKNGDDLPCFKYILENMGDGSTSTAASFSLAYIQYLQRCGITDRAHIESAFIKLALVAQRSFVARKEPLDLMVVKGKRYSFDTDASFEEYLKALLKACRDNPASFSVLYKKVDTKLSLCHLCPMSSQYSLSYEMEELKLARFTFENIGNYNKIITCIGDIEALFQSYIDIYNVLNNLTHSYSAPLYQILFKSIYIHTSAYFHSIFGTRQYPSIKSSFIKELGKYGLNSKAKNFEVDFDSVVYDYLVTSFSSTELIDEATALTYRQLLLERSKYVPEVDVDALPVSVNLTAHRKKKKDTESNARKNIDKTAQPAKKGSKTRKLHDEMAETYGVTLPLSDSFDALSGLSNKDSLPSKDAPLLEEKVIDQTDKVIEVSILKEDVVSKEGEIIVEHLVQEGEVLDYEDEDDIEEFDETEEPAIVEGATVDDTVVSVKSDIIEPISSALVLAETSTGTSEDTILIDTLSSGKTESLNEHDILADTASVSNTDAQELDVSKSEDTHAPDVCTPSERTESEQKEASVSDDKPFYLSELLSPITLSSGNLDELEEIVYKSQYDRLVSYIVSEGFFVAEPASISTGNKSIDVLLICLKKERYFIKLSSEYLQHLLGLHKYKLYGVRLICLYTFLEKHKLSYLHKDNFVPLLEELELASQTEIFKLPLTEYFTYLYQKASIFHRDNNAGEMCLSESLLRQTLLYTAYGFSYRKERFLTGISNSFFTYSDDGSVVFNEQELPSDISGLSGKIFDFSFQLPQLCPDDEGYFLTQDIIFRMCRGAFFQKFNLQLLYLSPTYIRIYADEYCMEYVYNYILMHFFKTGARYELKPLNVVVETRLIV